MQVYSVRSALAAGRSFSIEKDFKQSFLSEIETLHELGLFKYDLGVNNKLPLTYVANVSRVRLFLNKYNHNLEWPIEHYTLKEYIFDYVEIFYAHASLIDVTHVDRAGGKVAYTLSINRIFDRFQLPYRVNEHGKVIELSCRVLDDVILAFEFRTEDSELSALLLGAVNAFYDARTDRKKEGLKLIVDAFDRLKLSYDDHSKHKALQKCINAITDDKSLHDSLEKLLAALGQIENLTDIRHSENDSLADREMIEYLFYSYFSLVRLILKKSGND